MTHRILWSLISLLCLRSSHAFAAGSGSPWAAAANSYYVGVVGTYVPIALALVTIAMVIAYYRYSENEGLMASMLKVGVGASLASTSLAFVTFWGATPSAGATLDELAITEPATTSLFYVYKDDVAAAGVLLAFIILWAYVIYRVGVAVSGKVSARCGRDE
jgi:hypothetical protein